MWSGKASLGMAWQGRHFKDRKVGPDNLNQMRTTEEFFVVMVKKAKETAVEIQEIRMGTIRANLVGTSPLVMHRFASKAWHELLLPSGKKNSAEKSESLKHDPKAEFVEALYQNRSNAEPALFHYPSNAFGKALAAAAVDIPGATKAQMSRLRRSRRRRSTSSACRKCSWRWCDRATWRARQTFARGRYSRRGAALSRLGSLHR